MKKNKDRLMAIATIYMIVAIVLLACADGNISIMPVAILALIGSAGYSDLAYNEQVMIDNQLYEHTN